MRSTATILATFAFGYVLANIFRAVNAVIAPNLVADIGLDAAALGFLTSALLIAHGASQLPLGIALDRYGPRRVQATMFCCAATGAVLFAWGGDAITLTVARALIGAGFGGALMSGFKAVVMCLPPARHALGNSIIMAGGQTGLLIATWPAEFMVGLVGWRMVFVILAAVTGVAAMLYLVAVPDWKSSRPPQRLRQQIGGLARVFSDPAVWRIGPVVWMGSSVHIAMLTLWAGPWFRDVAGYDRAGVATGLLINAVCAVTGVFLGGWIADRCGRRGISVLVVMTGFMVVFYIAEIPMILGLDIAPSAWILFSLSGQAGILSYPWLAAHFGSDLSSRAQTGVNLGLFVFAFAMQYMVGAVIDLFEPAASGGYDPAGYRLSFAIILALQLAAMTWFLTGWRSLMAGGGATTRPST